LRLRCTRSQCPAHVRPRCAVNTPRDVPQSQPALAARVRTGLLDRRGRGPAHGYAARGLARGAPTRRAARDLALRASPGGPSLPTSSSHLLFIPSVHTFFTRGECAIAIKRWFHRTPDDPDGLTFVEWKPPDSKQLFVNSSQLRGIGFAFSPSVPRPLAKAVQRTSTRAAQFGSLLSTARRAVFGKPPPSAQKNQRWKLDADDDRTIRRRCEES
jgi:hypothetical protein